MDNFPHRNGTSPNKDQRARNSGVVETRREPPVSSRVHQAPAAGKLRTTWVVGLAGLLLVGLVGLYFLGSLPRQHREQALQAESAQAAATPLRVSVVTARRGETYAERVLPGNAQPLLDTTLYARTTGYLKSRLVDIGDQVKEGQLLAVIEAPDVDAQLAQARANLEQARANLPLAIANVELARITLARDLRSAPGEAVTWQQIDQDKTNVQTTSAQVAVARANISVNEAAVQRLTVLQGFQKITAPFPGIITARNVDPGALISADNPSLPRELFHLMRTDTLRVFVNVPQVFATEVQAGQEAFLFRREVPGKQFQGKVTRTSDALDPATRTLLTEVQVANPDNALRPGMYLQVKFVFRRDSAPVLIPTAAVVTRTAGPKVAVMDQQQTVHYRQVQLGRDYGAEVEVADGLREGDRIVLRPGDDLPEGTTVQPIAAQGQ